MDPYFEDPVVWPSFHHHVIGSIGAALNRVLPTCYVANVAERLYVAQPDCGIVPDISVQRASEPQPSLTVAAAVAEAVDVAWEVSATAEEVREAFSVGGVEFERHGEFGGPHRGSVGNGRPTAKVCPHVSKSQTVPCRLGELKVTRELTLFPNPAAGSRNSERNISPSAHCRGSRDVKI